MKTSGKIKLFLIPIIIIFCFSCEGKNKNKAMLYFDYTTNELRLVNIKTGQITNKTKMNLNITPGYINDDGLSYKWFYDPAGKYLYLKEINSGQNTKIYKIDIETFELSEIFSSEMFFHAIFVENDNLYLMNYIHGFDENPSKGNIFLFKHDLLSGHETVIDFNEALPQNEKINPHHFFIFDDKLIIVGRINNGALRKIFRYDIKLKTIDIIDSYIDFGVRNLNNFILYERLIADEIFKDSIIIGLTVYGRDLVFYDLINKNKTILPYQVEAYQDYIIVDQNTIIYSKEDDFTKKQNRLINDEYISYYDRGHLINFYLAEVNKNKEQKIFSVYGVLEILGIID